MDETQNHHATILNQMRIIGQLLYHCQNHQVKFLFFGEIFTSLFLAIVEQQLGGSANLPCLESDEDKGSTEPYKVTIYFGDANDNEHDVSILASTIRF